MPTLIIGRAFTSWVIRGPCRTVDGREMQPALAKVGLGWANFLVLRRTHATLMKEMGADGKLVADQLGHSLDVNQNVYTQSPVESRLVIVNQLGKSYG
jgi:integrase